MDGNDYTQHRITASHEAMSEAELMAENKDWNMVFNRLYYAAIYAVSVLLRSNGIRANSHLMIIRQFSHHFIKRSRFDKKHGRLLLDLRDTSKKLEFEDFFDFDEKQAHVYFKSVREMIEKIELEIGPKQQNRP